MDLTFGTAVEMAGAPTTVALDEKLSRLDEEHEKKITALRLVMAEHLEKGARVSVCCISR